MTKKNKKYLINIVDSLYKLDQSKRLLFNKVDSDYGLQKYSYIKRAYLKDSLGDNYISYNKTIDSIWNLIKIIDSSNTKRLIELTQKYGFPNNRRLGVYKNKAYMIFVHAPRTYFEDIQNLINLEFKEGRVSKYERDYIFWHLNGRKGMPPIKKND